MRRFLTFGDPRFRNENYSDEHLPEQIGMEWYWAYADWRDGMKLMTEMYRYALKRSMENHNLR